MILADNDAGLRLAHAHGFRTVGTHRAHATLSGRWRDVTLVERHLRCRTTPPLTAELPDPLIGAPEGARIPAHASALRRIRWLKRHRQARTSRRRPRAPTPSLMQRMFATMHLIRDFEERAAEEYMRGNIGGFLHLAIGEEAAVVGSVLALRPTDPITSTYREHGQALARGSAPRAVMAELFGRETGLCHGHGGSMHLMDREHHFFGGYGIVGGSIPLAVGLGFAISYRQEDAVALAMFGDGATNQGVLAESMNMAKLWNLPVVFFCLNNQYGMGTSVDRASAEIRAAQARRRVRHPLAPHRRHECAGGPPGRQRRRPPRPHPPGAR